MADWGYDSDSDGDSVALSDEESLGHYHPGGYHPTRLGDRLGPQLQYAVVRKLGWGHFSTVWLAWDASKLRHVAVKIVRSSPSYRDTAIDEIAILKTVQNGPSSHPGKRHIVQFLDQFVLSGPNGDHVCMVFEVLGENMLNFLIRYKHFRKEREGVLRKSVSQQMAHQDSDLPQFMSESSRASSLADLKVFSESYGGLPISLVKHIAKQLLLALDYLHRVCGIIHTDLKPENVMVEINDVERLVKLLELERINKKKIAAMKREQRDADQSSHFAVNRVRPRRKSSVPIIASKPLSSPVETSSCDNFFRSFSFSQRRPTVSSRSSSITSSVNIKPISFAKTPSLDDYTPDYAIEEEEEDEKEDEKEQQQEYEKDTPHDFTDKEDTKSISSESTASSSSDEAFVDALESQPPTSPTDYSDNPQSPSEADFDFDAIINVKIADLGNSCWYNKHYTSEIQTRQYRSPEVILGAPWGASTDMWSFSCMIFELATGDYLFDPRSSKSYSRDEDHLAQMVEILNYWPEKELLNVSARSREFFDKKGTTFRAVYKLQMWPLENVLVDAYKMDPQFSREFASFLRCGLRFLPRDRIDAGSAYHHSWLWEGAPKEYALQRDFGLKGEDIKGYIDLWEGPDGSDHENDYGDPDDDIEDEDMI